MNQRILHNRPFAFWPFSFLLVVVLSGCTVGPNYKRPAVNVPTVYRQPGEETTTAKPSANAPQNTPARTAQSAAASLGDEKWWEVFEDKELQGLIRTALKNNYDVRIAATRVLQAQAQLGITRADQLPSVSVGGNITSQQNAASGPIPSFEQTHGQLDATASWNLDFWGRYRRANQPLKLFILKDLPPFLISQ
jgi:multidrug efflux system outer membrane protein